MLAMVPLVLLAPSFSPPVPRLVLRRATMAPSFTLVPLPVLLRTTMPVMRSPPPDNLTSKKLIANIFEGHLGERGELYFVGQAALLSCILVGPELPGIRVVSTSLGLLSLAVGVVLAVTGAYELGTSLSPWPKPVVHNELATDGVYSIVRHPMYSGVLLDSGGFSLLTASYERLLLTIVLFLLFTAKARREEQELVTRHGDEYAKWAARVPRFFPNTEGLRRLPSVLIEGESKA